MKIKSPPPIRQITQKTKDVLQGTDDKCLETCLQTDPKTPMGLVEQEVFCLVFKGVQWQAKFACLNTCWMCVMKVGGTVS